MKKKSMHNSLFAIHHFLFLSIILTLFACQKEDAATDPRPAPATPTVPHVAVTFPQVTSDAVTAHFAMNPLCTQYTILLSESGSMAQWTSMFGTTATECVLAWGITFTTDTTYTWSQQIPATDFLVYVLAVGKTADDRDTIILDSIPVSTASIGGSGESLVTISVDNITSTSAIVTCTPNDQTALFKDMLITVEAFNRYGQDSAIAMLKTDPYVYYTTDVWTWADLEPNTPYYVLAIGQNADGQWGPLARETFRTH